MTGPLNEGALPRAAVGPVRRGEIVAWAFFDFANSSFTTVVVTVVFPVYFTKVLCAGRADADGLWSLALALSNLAVVLLSPVLGALADVLGAKKRFLLGSTALCVGGTLALAFVPEGAAWWGVWLFVVANIGFALGENFVAGFLPELSTPQTAGRISALGWSIGYFGGLLSLVLCVVVLKVAGWPVSVALGATALFFLVSSLPTFLVLRERKTPEPWPQGTSVVGLAFEPLMATLRELPRHRALFTFFASFFFFMGGLGTVIGFAGIFAERELGMSEGELTQLFIFLQLAAAAGAYAFGHLQDRWGSLRTISATLWLWIAVVTGCYLTESQGAFYGVAVGAGLAMGATQSCSRALVSELAPEGRSGEFFGFWGVFGKMSWVVSAPIFGALSVTYGIRTALLGTLGLFILGLVILQWVRVPAKAS